MFSKTSPVRLSKRPNEDSSMERPRKIPHGVVKIEDDENDRLNVEKIYRFRILLPNGTTLELRMRLLRREMPIEEFIEAVQKEYFNAVKERNSTEVKRKINWKYRDLHFTDVQANKIRLKVNFQDFNSDKWNLLRLHDGSAEPETYEDMWDLTPDTDFLKELPDEYTFETALADLIDNSLQALWSNCHGERRLISVELSEDKISIFDSGPGMDGSNGNIANWGKMGASLHRASRAKAVGGKPPYLMPFFGMFGYGGPVATMHLGRRALLSSKTKKCNKVFTLHLEKDALIKSTNLEKRWRTKGGMRDPTHDEIKKSPHGSYTKVEISDLKMRSLDVKLLQCRLKDIYFPYIQFDDTSGKTRKPIEFQVNGIDLAEIEGGEVATTNLHSGNGTEFTLQLHFTYNEDTPTMNDQRNDAALEANARLKCVYFPVKEGEESINRIINKLEQDGYGIRESYEGFSRVSIRRLGRLLPDARWSWLPFMEPKLRKGERAQILKRCCFRVKCFIDTDSGFNPTPSKTDLAHHHPYTFALKNFGNMTPGNKKEVQIEISRDGKKLNLSQLEKQYHDWILEMHDHHDEEIDTGLDEPTIVFIPKNKKLGRFSDVARVHKVIRRKGTLWEAGQKIKIIKGACTGCHNNNVFATIEYILLQGFQGDACGEARLICRPLGIPEDQGCVLLPDGKIDICRSISVPISVIDSEKCIAIDDTEWKNQLEKYGQKLPSSIDLLSRKYCQELGIEGGLLDGLLEAGESPPENIVAVIRPKAFNFSSNSKKLDQKFIVKDVFEMRLTVTRKTGGKNARDIKHICSVMKEPTSCKGFHGLYIFPLRLKIPEFREAGRYTFSLSVNDLTDVRFEQDVQVKTSAEPGTWKILSDKNARHRIRVGSTFPQLSVGCYDQYGNTIPFKSVPELMITLISSDNVLAHVKRMKVDVTTDKSTMIIKDVFIKSSKLDKIRPSFEATLKIRTLNEFSVDCRCQVLPGSPEKIALHPAVLKGQLVPGQILDDLSLEVFDSFGNHVEEDELICLHVDGFSFVDETVVVSKIGTGYMLKVDANGYVDLGNNLKVSKGYGKDVTLSVISGKKSIFKLDFRTEMRELETVTKVFKNCEAGSQLENIVFEIINPEGAVDETINDDEKHGQLHTLKIMSDSFGVDDSVRYSFRHGRCSIRAIPLPRTEGIYYFKAVHSRYPELHVDIEVHVEKIWRENHDNVANLEDLENYEHSTEASCRNFTNLCQTPRSTVSAGDPGYIAPQSLKRNLFPSDYSPALKRAKVESNNAQKASGSQNFGTPMGCSLDVLETLTDDITQCGLEIGQRERKIEMLELRRSTIKQQMSDIQASLDRDSGYVCSQFDKESIRKRIEKKSESAAGIVCKSLAELPFEERSGILGVVALLGSVQTTELSRMLGQYLGEEQMLAIVCKNYAAAEALETGALQKLATKFGRSIRGGYHALCLEDVRPNILSPSRVPTLRDGSRPQGFLGYAVNMVSIEETYSHWRTKADYTLKETLFYRLFGELQVYEDKKCMKMAHSHIKDGAISLDGGIMRGNGLVSLGCWEPEIYFPVKNMKPLSADCLEVLARMEEKKLELALVNSQIEEENKLYQMNLDNFQKSKQRFTDFENGYYAQRSSQDKLQVDS